MTRQDRRAFPGIPGFSIEGFPERLDRAGKCCGSCLDDLQTYDAGQDKGQEREAEDRCAFAKRDHAGYRYAEHAAADPDPIRPPPLPIPSPPTTPPTT